MPGAPHRPGASRRDVKRAVVVPREPSLQVANQPDGGHRAASREGANRPVKGLPAASRRDVKRVVVVPGPPHRPDTSRRDVKRAVVVPREPNLQVANQPDGGHREASREVANRPVKGLPAASRQDVPARNVHRPKV